MVYKNEIKEIELFNIPIYSYSKAEFDQKWENKKLEGVKSWLESGKTVQQAKYLVQEFSHPYCIWKYNQIIGWFNVSIREQNDIFIEVFLTDAKTIRFDSTRKTFVVEKTSTNMHFDTTGMNNQEIVERIYQIISNYQKEKLARSRYIDFTNFNNVYQYIDYNKIIKNFKDWPL